jgi:two-component system, sensor histidine kinase PdtaS
MSDKKRDEGRRHAVAEKSSGSMATPDYLSRPRPAPRDRPETLEQDREERRIEAALKEKNILLGEIHHRVANNLQTVYSLLDLQSARISDQSTIEMLRDTQNRVRSMAIIHQTLYASNDFANVDFAQFLETLLPVLIASYAVDRDMIDIHIEGSPIRLPIAVAVPCGLMINELVTNAIKHAFRDGDRGHIQVALARHSANEAMLSVSDNGIGYPAEFALAKAGTLGLHLVKLLSDQIGGAVTFNRANPTRFSIRFPIE